MIDIQSESLTTALPQTDEPADVWLQIQLNSTDKKGSKTQKGKKIAETRVTQESVKKNCVNDFGHCSGKQL